MPLTLEQYAADYLPTRGLPWPQPPTVEAPKAKPHVAPQKVKAVLWTAYGTLLNVPGGELAWEHKTDFVMEAALDKTIKEFKMWQSMSRKPGKPADYMKELYNKALTTLQLTGGGAVGEKIPEIASERVWDDIVKKLFQKEYTFDVVTYGALNEYVKKIAYFFHASIQGCGAYDGAALAVGELAQRGIHNGLLADGQCFTPAQIHKTFREQDPGFDVNTAFPANLRILSAEKKARKPSDTLFKAAVDALKAKGIAPHEVLHVGSSLTRDIAPAKKYGFRTALFAGDKASLSASGELLKDPATKPDIMLTALPQVAQAVA